MKLLATILFYLSFAVCFSQTNTEILDYNNVSGLLLDEGLLFNDPISGQAAYEVPKGGGVNAIMLLHFGLQR